MGRASQRKRLRHAAVKPSTTTITAYTMDYAFHQHYTVKIDERLIEARINEITYLNDSEVERARDIDRFTRMHRAIVADKELLQFIIEHHIYAVQAGNYLYQEYGEMINFSDIIIQHKEIFDQDIQDWLERILAMAEEDEEVDLYMVLEPLQEGFSVEESHYHLQAPDLP